MRKTDVKTTSVNILVPPRKLIDRGQSVGTLRPILKNSKDGISPILHSE